MEAPPDWHPLDHPVWNALGSTQREFNIGSENVRRFCPEVALFAALPDYSERDIANLAEAISPGSVVGLVTRTRIEEVPEPLTVFRSITVEQMISSTLPAVTDRPAPVTLSAGDVPAMCDLAAKTRPGPFEARTIELGRYIGLRSGDRLLAMAGERMKLDDFTEISAVCTDPEFRGRGYARQLVEQLTGEILARGETPFLHVVSENTAAIALYEKLGYQHRATMNFTVLSRST